MSYFNLEMLTQLLKSHYVQLQRLIKCIWHYSKNGEYNVRYAYRLVMEHLADLTYSHVSNEWSKLCQLQLPLKMKNFV